ncbi:MAG: hypothetical protein GXY76_10745 [Chloroflexi bacterium]|nr:hypothetical protein [Chloroflexota bacterium]
MLFESDVIEMGCAELKSRGYIVEQRPEPTRRGEDIIAAQKQPRAVRLYLGAKGETSRIAWPV